MPIDGPETLSTLASADKTVWELRYNFRNGKSYYFNNLTKERQYDSVPHALDTIGKTCNLRQLVLTSNILTHLPNSVVQLCALEDLKLDHNLIEQLPPSIHKMTGLRSLSIADNRLTSLPDDMCKMYRLHNLCVSRNMLTKLPLYIGNLTRLKKLWINNNAIEELPWTMGQLVCLKDLLLGDNPVADRWRDVLQGEGKIARMLEIMRELRLRALRGEPPSVSIAETGLLNEIVVPLPRKAKLWAQFCTQALSTGYVDLHWNQLREVPKEIISMKSLVELRLSNNYLESIPGQIGEMEHLRVLHLTNNKLSTLPSTIVQLKNLAELAAEDNKITELPDKITLLFRMRILRLSRNLIEKLPAKIGKMAHLQVLEMNVNRLRDVPESLGGMHRLKRLLLNKNRIRSLPDSMARMTSLETLNLNSNLVQQLPLDLFTIPNLKTLLAGHNRLKRLDHSLGDGPCSETLQVLWIMGNRIRDLPHTFHRLHSLTDIRIEDTPIRSPTAELCLRGADWVKSYCFRRETRIQCIRSFLRARGILLSRSRLAPYPSNFFSSNGYLGPKDMENLAQRLDECVNGDFLSSPTEMGGKGGVSLPKSLSTDHLELPSVPPFDLTQMPPHEAGDPSAQSTLRQSLTMGLSMGRYIADVFALREHEHDEAVLNSVIARVDVIAASFKGLQEHLGLQNTFHQESTRPWGEEGAVCKVHCIALEDIGVLKPGEAEGPQPIPYSMTDVVTSAQRFVNVYGHPGAKMGRHKFQKPAKDSTKRARKKVSGKTVTRDAIVIQAVIFSIDEHDRKVMEDRSIERAVKEQKVRIDDWLRTPTGRKRLQKRARLMRSKASATVKALSKRLRKAKKSCEGKKEAKKKVDERANSFASGEPKHMHQFDNQAQVDAAISKASDAVHEAEEKISSVKSHLQIATARRKQPRRMWKDTAETVLHERYKEQATSKLTEHFRISTFEDSSLRRPWDPKFRKWKKRYKKNIEKQAKIEKEQRYAALGAIDLKEDRDTKPVEAYDSSILGQIKGWIRDIGGNCRAAFKSKVNNLSEALAADSTRGDTFRWSDDDSDSSGADEMKDEGKDKKSKSKSKRS